MVTELTVEGGLNWVVLSEAEPEELASFVREAKLLPVDAEFVVQDHHRPGVTVRDDYIIVLIYVPTFERNLRVTSGAPLYFIVRENTIWTVSHQNIVVLDRLIQDFEENKEKRIDYFADGPMALAIHLIDEMNQSSFHKLERLGKHVSIAEDAIFSGNERKMVEEISILMRDVIDFRKIVRPQRQLFMSVPRHSLLSTTLEPLWRRLHDENSKLWEILDSLFESMKELRDTNDSLLQHKENQLLRLLTYYSTVSIPLLIFLSAITPFGPGATPFHTLLFWITMGLLLFFLVIIFAHFKRKRII